jgi:hypothetical protein
MKTLLKLLLVINVFVNAYLVYKVSEKNAEYTIALVIVFIIYAITTNIILGEVILEQKKVDKI